MRDKLQFNKKQEAHLLGLAEKFGIIIRVIELYYFSSCVGQNKKFNLPPEITFDPRPK